ncbi:cAMP-responsive element modulator isoform X3 [Parambassis ranga]|uniref:cAMP-responsive element modulator isoform X3 n=1 Tax=Parambassis ranga TaxID=210632 RepID=A0A6P7K4B2_9TELE|nr:cAMP-responsive element modulator-like isoform X3 [Parambassis ranga]
MDASMSPQLDSCLSGSVTDGEENHSEAGPSPAQVTIVQLSDGQTVQVPGIIQAPQTSVIQSLQVQTVQVTTAAELEDDESATDAQKRREVLSRRPSYRVPIAQRRAVQLSSPGAETLQGGQTLTLTISPTHILQCAAQPGDAPQQLYIQGGQMDIQAATGDIPAYQLRSPNSGLAQSIVMAASPGSMQSPSSQHAEDITRKREVRLMKNREAARECRRKKKEYVKCLENRVAVLENQNKTLIEELKALKDIYCHKAE